MAGIRFWNALLAAVRVSRTVVGCYLFLGHSDFWGPTRQCKLARRLNLLLLVSLVACENRLLHDTRGGLATKHTPHTLNDIVVCTTRTAGSDNGRDLDMADLVCMRLQR